MQLPGHSLTPGYPARCTVILWACCQLLINHTTAQVKASTAVSNAGGRLYWAAEYGGVKHCLLPGKGKGAAHEGDVPALLHLFFAAVANNSSAGSRQVCHKILQEMMMLERQTPY